MQDALVVRHLREVPRRDRPMLADFLLWLPKMDSAISLVHPSEIKTRDTTTRAHRILVCVDCAKPDDTCLPYAIVLARALGSELTLLHVMQPDSQPHLDALDWEISRQE